MKYLKLSLVTLIVLALFVSLKPQEAQAQSEQCPYPGCFAGYSLPFMYSCTCSTYYNWMVFFPFHTNGIITGAAMSVPMIVNYSIYSTSPAQRYVGTYVPGLQSCWIYAVYGCFTLPVYGTVLEMTGVGEPGPFY